MLSYSVFTLKAKENGPEEAMFAIVNLAITWHIRRFLFLEIWLKVIDFLSYIYFTIFFILVAPEVMKLTEKNVF